MLAITALGGGCRMTARRAEVLGIPRSTVSGIVTRIGLGKLSRLEPPEPPNRCAVRPRRTVRPVRPAGSGDADVALVRSSDVEVNVDRVVV